MISLYLPGTSPIHRAPAWLKLLVLALGAIVLSLLPNSWGLAAAAFLLPALAYAAAGLSARIMARDLRAMLVLVIFLVGTQLIFSPPLAAVCNTARVLAVVLLAQVLTRTTRADARGRFSFDKVAPGSYFVTTQVIWGAEDAAQEVLLRLWRTRETYDPARASVRTWAYAIASRYCIDLLRAAPRKALPTDLSERNGAGDQASGPEQNKERNAPGDANADEQSSPANIGLGHCAHRRAERHSTRHCAKEPPQRATALFIGEKPADQHQGKWHDPTRPQSGQNAP